MRSQFARVAVITPVRGRLEHLINQRRFLTEVAPGVQHVVVAVDTPNLTGALARQGANLDGLHIVDTPGDRLGMPTAKTRNVGAERALDLGCELLIFLDVDCVPLPGMVEGIVNAATTHGHRSVLNAPVTYLTERQRLRRETPNSARRLVAPHPVRPHPATGQIRVGMDHHLLWSLAFGLTAQAWSQIGGFAERYVGYGGEDTDFGMLARRAGLSMAWVGGAYALHQWHPSSNPPRHHLVDIVRNARIYYERWGMWPMEGWLREFAREGLVRWTSTSLELTPTGWRFAAKKV